MKAWKKIGILETDKGTTVTLRYIETDDGESAETTRRTKLRPHPKFIDCMQKLREHAAEALGWAEQYAKDVHVRSLSWEYDKDDKLSGYQMDVDTFNRKPIRATIGFSRANEALQADVNDLIGEAEQYEALLNETASERYADQTDLPFRSNGDVTDQASVGVGATA